ncbi:hypothetical protein BHAOGJBA_1734 [Methylobacterium hispanicum]|uniref:Uncharacterized protein n=1 Tax=Methylobacterium hispanicum TaxID=270350 RepID=A0AAV4ZIC4_9HYPH|nr:MULTISPECIES: hypothetical protein [Methylobacterium]GJD88221.1 hypothetical protein BHAOGJBA_1734 [Methylobacterium hispanicum]
MSDRATQLARCLMEEGIRFPVGQDGKIAPGSIRTFLADRFPGISQAEVTRGVLIAIELAKLDRGLR